MVSVALRRYTQLKQWPWPTLDRWVTLLGVVLSIGIALHHIILIYVLPWGSEASMFFGETQIVIFAGFASILTVTLYRMPAERPAGYKWANRLLLLAQLLLFAAAILRAKGPDGPTYDTLSMLSFIAIHLCSVWALAPLFPWRTLPRFDVLRLGAETALVLALFNMLFQLILPIIVPQWTPTPLILLTQFRLIASIGLCYWYIEAYRRFGKAQRRFLILASCGLSFMLLNDMALLWAVIQVTASASGKLIRATGVIWMLQQLCWVLALYWAMRVPVSWNAEKQNIAASQQHWWRKLTLQGVLLIGVVMVACSISPSWPTTLWITAALLSRESVIRYEREQLQQADRAARNQLEQANRQLTNYARQADELATLRERTRVARDLHDSLGAGLTAIGIQLEVCATTLKGHPAVAQVASAQYLTDQLLDEARRTVHNVRVPATPSTLHARIENLLQPDRAAGLTVKVEQHGKARPLDEAIEEVLFRVAQEGITNMRKYAQATHFVVQVDYRNPDHVRLHLQDNGRGVDCTNHTGGSGLQGMRERLQALGGDARIRSAPGQGFELIAEVPA